jgi:hypothetical protein
VNDTIIYHKAAMIVAQNVEASISGFAGGTVLFRVGAIRSSNSTHLTLDGARELAAQLNAACDVIEAQQVAEAA